MNRLLKGVLGAVLSLSILSGAASALPQTEEADATSEVQQSASQEDDITAADLVSGESMVFLPNGMRAVTLVPGTDFCTGEQTDALNYSQGL